MQYSRSRLQYSVVQQEQAKMYHSCVFRVDIAGLKFAMTFVKNCQIKLFLDELVLRALAWICSGTCVKTPL